MRPKHLARLGRAPANGNCHRREDPGHAARARAAVPGDAGADDQDRCIDPDGDVDQPGFHAGVPCPSCGRRLAALRLHRDRQLWILARELCASASLYGVGGRAPTALRSLKLAATLLSGRAGTYEPAAVRD